MRRKLHSLLLVIASLMLVNGFVLVARGDAPQDSSSVTEQKDEINLASNRRVEARAVASVQPKVPQGFLTEASDGDALEIALAYIRSQREAYGLTAADVAEFIVTDRYVTEFNGVTHIYLSQSLNGLEVYGTTTNVHVMEDGRIVAVGNQLITGLAEVPSLQTPKLSAVEAVGAAADHLGVTLAETPTILQNGRGVAQETILSKAGISRDNIPAKLMYQRNEQGELRLVWNLVINMVANDDWWNLHVDSKTGEVLSQNNWTIYESHAGTHANSANSVETEADKTSDDDEIEWHPPLLSPATGAYEVYAMPIKDPADGDRVVVDDPSDDIASPFGWHDTDGVEGAEYLITRGNNVHAYADPLNINQSSGDEPNGGPSLLFAYPIDLDQQPPTYMEAATTNLFYWNNIIHDVMYYYGFDEVSGNFQANNYGNGGSGGDAVQAQSQDGGGFTNANFATPADGNQPRMQMYLGGPGPGGINRDGSLDNHVVVHEYGHGITNRLVGGPSNTNCINQQEQGGEGWSDWYGNVFTAQVGDDGADPITVGNWLAGQSPNGPGFRPYPYSTDMSINPSTYADVPDSGTFSVPHGVGTIWASMIWDMYWLMVDRDGFDPDFYNGTGGNNLAMFLVTDGLRYTVCEPTFVDERNAILTSDLVNHPITPTPADGFPQSENECLIWEAFARRGLGYSADDGGTTSRFDGTAAFDMPPQCLAAENFEVTATPASTAICSSPAEDATYIIDIISYLGFNDAVTLSAVGEPAGTTATFSPNGSNAPYTSTLTIGNTAVAISGTYPITITGTSALTTAYTMVDLEVFSSTPTTVTLLSPADGSVDVSPLSNLTLSWDVVDNIFNYTLEVATDDLFSNIIYSNTLTSESEVLAQGVLSSNQTYYWRVSASNLCGTNVATQSYSFTTRDTADVLLVDDDADDNGDSKPYYTDALDALGIPYDVWDTGSASATEPTSALLDIYSTVVWGGGELQAITSDGEDELATYLDNGGCLFVTAQDYHFVTGVTPFMNEYLGVASAVNDVGHNTVTGAGPFAGLGPYTLLMPPGYGNWSDDFTPTASAAMAFSGDAGAGVAAVYKDAGTYKTTFWGFPFEAIPTDSERATALLEVVTWCDASLSGSLSFIELDKTASIDNSCNNSGDRLVVPSGSTVTYCYDVENVGGVTYTNHTLVDDDLGLLIDDAAVTLAPGATYQYSTTKVVTQSVTNTAVWTATATLEMASSTDSVTVDVVTPMAFNSCLGFEDGNFPASMAAQVTTSPPASGRVQVTTNFPYAGNYALDIDTDISNFFTQQAAVLSVDLAGQTDVELNFWVIEHGDENHAPDGVFISDDNGATYSQILSLHGFPRSYTNIQIDLDEAVTNAGLTLTDNFLIKFQSFDNFSIASDGYSFDNICVQPATPALAVTKQAPAYIVNNQTFTYTVALSNAGLVTATNTTLSDTIPVGTTYVASSVAASSGSASYNGGNDAIEWSGDVTSAGVTVTFQVDVTAVTGDLITNTAVISDTTLDQPLRAQFFSWVVDALSVPAVYYHRQNVDTVNSAVITMDNLGFDDLTWTLFESDCTTPVNIPWVDAATTNGTIAGGDSFDLTLDFDTTGLSVSTYGGDLCIASTHDGTNAETFIDLTLVADADFTVDFAATVGTTPGECATTDSITVLAGTEVYYCYTVENTSNVAYVDHQLVEATAGILLSTTLTLEPSQMVTVTITDTVSLSVTQALTWTASNGSFEAMATDSVSVIVEPVIPPMPMIVVAPDTLGASVLVGEVATQTLTISNTGTGDLEWELFEIQPPSPNRTPIGWGDNFDSYSTGMDLHGVNGWKGWDNDPTFTAFTSDVQARSAPNSVDIVGNADLIREYNYDSGQWTYLAWQYIPADFSGQAYFIMQNTYSDGGTKNWSVQVCFNSSTGFMYDDVAADCSSSANNMRYITEQWVQIRVEIDLDNNTQSFYYDNQLLYQDSWTEHVSGGGASNIASVDLFANGSSSVYYDDLYLLPSLPSECSNIGDISWLDASPTSGTIGDGLANEVALTYDATGLDTGTYTGNLCIANSSTNEPYVTVPVTFTVAATTSLQVVHLAPFATGDAAVDVYLDGALTLSDFGYAESTGYLTVLAGEYFVEVMPAGTSTVAISGTIMLDADSYNTVIAIGGANGYPLELMQLVDNVPPTFGPVGYVRIGHLAPFDATLANTAVNIINDADDSVILADVTYGTVSDYLALPAGEYDLRIELAADDSLLFDLAPVTVAEGVFISAFAAGDGTNQTPDVYGVLGGAGALPSLLVPPVTEYHIYMPTFFNN